MNEMNRQITDILTNIRPEFDFNQAGVNFFEEGMLDSFDLVALVTELEETFGVSIDGIDIVPEHFSSIERIESLIVTKKGAK